jgi:hypothetical protein
MEHWKACTDFRNKNGAEKKKETVSERKREKHKDNRETFFLKTQAGKMV